MITVELFGLGHLFKSDYYLIAAMIVPEALPDRSIVEALRKKGYKATPQRIAICRFVIHSRDHPTAQRIYKEVKAQYPTVSLATVYKTIDVLKELRMAQELATVDGDTRFDSDMEAHLNLVCVRCGKIRDFDGMIVKEMLAKVAGKAKFNVRAQSLAVYGLCQNCAMRKNA
jgi:Fur family peroxide stress response transcriptional regulator